MTHPHTLSIIVPVFYSEASLEELHCRLMQIAAALAPLQVKLIFVDDGSGDQSFAVLKGVAATQPTMRVVNRARNFGANAAIPAGISQATGDAVAFVSADLQDPPELLVQMAQVWQAGNKVVFAVRANRDDPLVSRWLAEAFNALFHRLVLRDAPPTGVGFFLVDKQVAGLLLACEERNANLINLIVWLGFRPHQILYDRPARLRQVSLDAEQTDQIRH